MKIPDILFFTILFSLASYYCSYGQQKVIPYILEEKKMDGNLEDWEAVPYEIKNPIIEKYRNQNHAALEWDDDHLYVAFKVSDKILSINEHGEGNPRLYFNDGVEVYIDTKNDSREKMDKNDYQFMLTISDEKVVFKGDKHLISEGHNVPKDFDNNDILIKSKVLIRGTVNQMNDDDEGFVAEMAIPWAAIGIIPSTNLQLKIDLCVNDVDTFTNIKAIPDTLHPLSMNYINLVGKTEFGYPSDWTTFQLIGGPTWVQKITKNYKNYFIPLLLIILVFVSTMTYIIIRQYKKIHFYKSFPNRSDYERKHEIPYSSIEVQESIVPIKPMNETIQNLHNYILDHIDDVITIDELSQVAALGSRQLQRLFKQEVELTPIQYINMLKLEEACHLLNSTTLTVAEIAFKLSYSEPSYFGSVFKKYYGLTPIEFRKGQKKA